MRPAWEAPPARPPLEFTPEILFVFAFCAVVGLLSSYGQNIRPDDSAPDHV
jgi:hypothetical protein